MCIHRREEEKGQAQVKAQVEEAQQQMALEGEAWKKRRRLSKQLSMCGEIAWERRRRQERRRNSIHNCEENNNHNHNHNNDVTLTDDDLRELKGCIELGFGFKEEEGQKLCNTLPALDLYFAVNRQLSPSPVSTPHSRNSSSFVSPISTAPPAPPDADSWKICSPGDDPEHVKTKLRHWAQAVACSVMQSH